MNKEYVLFLYSLSYDDDFFVGCHDTEDIIEICVKGADLSEGDFCARAYAIAAAELAKKYPTMICLDSLKLLRRYSRKKLRTENER